jgi:Mg2+ and Co2+ transporter CorA
LSEICNSADCPKFDALEDDEFLQTLVLDSDTQRSVLYFKVLQVLRIFSDSLLSSSNCLDVLIDNCWGSSKQSDRLKMSHLVSSETAAVLRRNWDVVKTRHSAATKHLLARIARTTEEVKSLRDGVRSFLKVLANDKLTDGQLFNAQSVAEAQKNRQLSKYLVVFTVVTLLYLPPTFVAVSA